MTAADLEKFARELWRAYGAASYFTKLPWEKLKPEVQQEFRRYALAILARTGRQT